VESAGRTSTSVFTIRNIVKNVYIQRRENQAEILKKYFQYIHTSDFVETVVILGYDTVSWVSGSRYYEKIVMPSPASVN